MSSSPMPTQITFASQSQFLDCVFPYQQEDVLDFLSEQQVEVHFDSELTTKKIVPLNPDPNLSFATVFEGSAFKVSLPELPRTPHQMSLIFKAHIRSIHDLTDQDVDEMHEVIQKITEIYQRKLDIDGFVLAHYLKPCPRHHEQYVVELLPHQPGLKGYRDFLDKADSNRYVLYNDQSYSPLPIDFCEQEREEAAVFWKKELNRSQEKLTADETSIPLPTLRKDAHTQDGRLHCLNHLMEYFQHQGAKVEPSPLKLHTFKIPSEIPDKIWETASCAFCRPSVIEKQTVFEYRDVLVLYNFRKMPYEGTSFLVIPKRHTEQLYGPTHEEARTLHFLEKALMSVLKEKFPDFEVLSYNQGNFSVGQTVPHTHDQVVALDPLRTPFHWSFRSIVYKQDLVGGVSSEEMKKVTEEFHQLLQAKVEELENEKENLEAVI